MIGSFDASTLWKCSLGTLAWGGGAIGALQLGQISTGRFSHLVCGPWGCGPPAEALLAYHGFWLMLLMPPAIVYSLNDNGLRVRRFGMLLTAAGFAGLVGIMGWTTFRWLPNGYVVQHALFVVATLIDVPIVQLTACGLGCWIIGRYRHGRQANFDLDHSSSV